MININKTFYNYLYNELQAKYIIDTFGVEDNLENDKEKNLKYLGTYFPRSFVESYDIYNNLFNNDDIFDKYNKKDTINILDIGSGIGGSLFGLIQVIMEKFNNKQIKIISIEGNKNAIDLQISIFKNLKKLIPYKNKIHVSCHCIKFKNKNELETKLMKLGMDGSIDIMQSFKVVNEFYHKDYKSNKGMYSHLMYLGNKWLKKSGILCIVDVTNKINNTQYASIIFNEEVKKFMCDKQSELIYIIPRCCAINYENCTKTNVCFSKRTFDIHFENTVDKSKVNCKVFIKPDLGEKVKNQILNEVCEWYEEYTCYCKDIDDDYNCTKMLDAPYLL